MAQREKRRRGPGPEQLFLFEQGRPEREEVRDRFEGLNRRWFGGLLPTPRIRFSSRMLRAGAVFLDRPEVVLSVPYHDRHGWGEELDGTLKHEMVHMWLDFRGRPSGHTEEFYGLCSKIGAPHYCRHFGRPYKYVYRCPNGHEVQARRKLRHHSCAICSGEYDPRFPLRLARRLR